MTMKQTTRHILTMPLVAALALGLGFVSNAHAQQNAEQSAAQSAAAPNADSRAQTQAQANPQIEKQRQQAEEQAKKSLDQDAVAAIKETENAIKAIAQNKKDE